MSIPDGFMAVEHVTHNEDDSVTVLGHDRNGDPVIQTFPAQSVVTVYRPDAR